MTMGAKGDLGEDLNDEKEKIVHKPLSPALKTQDKEQ